MKSPLKIALALGVFLFLSSTSYFLVTYLPHSNSAPTSAPGQASHAEQRVVANSTRQQQQQREEPLKAASVANAAPAVGQESPGAAAAASEVVAPAAGSSTTQDQEAPPPPTSPQLQLDAQTRTMESSGAPLEPSPSEAMSPSTANSSTTTASSAQTVSSAQEQPEGGGQLAAYATSFDLYARVTRQPIEFYDISEKEREQWQEFKLKYKKIYKSEQEELRRQEIFVGNSRFIATFNRVSGAQFELGMNHFGDYENEEINQLFVGPQTNWTQTIGQAQSSVPPPIRILAPDSGAASSAGLAAKGADWRHLEGSEPVDQGLCRESSIFAAAASLEAKLNSERAPQKVKLSETQLLECLGAAGAPVCSGTISMLQVFDFLQRNPVRLASAHEYAAFQQARAANQAGAGAGCDILAGAPEPRARLQSFTEVHRDNLDEALENSGPLVVAIDATQPTFHFYKSGVYHERNCSQDSYSLHVLLVGQQASPAAAEPDSAPEATYWIRASFGADWGQLGHMQLAKDAARNKCLPQNLAIYPNMVFA